MFSVAQTIAMKNLVVRKYLGIAAPPPAPKNVESTNPIQSVKEVRVRVGLDRAFLCATHFSLILPFILTIYIHIHIHIHVYHTIRIHMLVTQPLMTLLVLQERAHSVRARASSRG